MNITAADAVITLQIPPIYTRPVQIQGFAPDSVFDVPTLKSSEVLMGVDGKKSSGFVFVPVPMTITLMADSLSNRVFDDWWRNNQANKTDYEASGLILLPGVATKWTQVKGSLTGYKPVPQAGRILRERTYEITWESILPSPV
jgi:hypothetical protein